MSQASRALVHAFETESGLDGGHHERPDRVRETAGCDLLAGFGVGEPRHRAAEEHRGVHRGDDRATAGFQHAAGLAEEAAEFTEVFEH